MTSQPAKNPRGVRVALGEIDGIKLGVRRYAWRDPYYFVLTISWKAFFVLAAAFYLVSNLCFASAYLLVPGCINNARPGVFLDHFFFSIETLATVGYGVMSPATLYGHLVASIEILYGTMSLAVLTGLVFTRFSRPRPRVMFSKVVVVAPFDGKTALMLRIVNERHQAVADATARLTMLRTISDSDGRRLRRFIDLNLLRASIPMLGLSWTLIHVIDESSPLHGLTSADVHAEGILLMASIGGYDESISASIVARKSYSPDAIRFGHEFVDIMSAGEAGVVVLDMARFHDTTSVVTPS